MKAYRESYVSSIPEYLSALQSDPIVKRLKGGTTEALFRGHSSVDYILKPSIYRTKNTAVYEREMVREFINNSSHMIKNEPRNQVEWLFLMQHHGLPTRLLDWSESPLVALFFAVEHGLPNSIPDSDACVWILDPWRLNSCSMKDRRSLPSTNSRDMLAYIVDPDDPNIPRHPSAPHPLAIRSQRNSSRSINQRAMVTIHGSEPISLSDFEKNNRENYLSKITINSKMVNSIYDDLVRLGVSNEFIYPGLDGLSRTIRRKFVDKN